MLSSVYVCMHGWGVMYAISVICCYYIRTLYEMKYKATYASLPLCSRDSIDAAPRNPSVIEAVQLGDNPTYDCPKGPGDDKRRTNVETQIQESLRNE